MVSVLFEGLHKEGASLASLLTAWAAWEEGPLPLAKPTWGDNMLTRECEFSWMCKFFPTSWHLLQMCVWKLFQMFQSLCCSWSLDSILISLCQRNIQNTSRHPLGSAAVMFCAIFLLFFL